MSNSFNFLTVMRSLVIAAAVLIASLSSVHAGDKLKLVATTGMIGNVVTIIAGERADVKSLMGEGVDPHLYRQTQSDIIAMAKSDAVFWNGLYLEAQLEEFFEKLAKHKAVFAVGEAVPVEKRLSSVQYPDRFDPHIWMDPDLWRYVVVEIKNKIIEIDPEGEAYYNDNANDFLTKLGELSVYSKTILKTVPENNKILVTAHDAFGYFGRAHDYDVIGIQGISTQSEAGLQQIDRIVKLIVERNIASIFVESSVSERNVLALVEGADALGHKVVIGGKLYSDAMGRAGTYRGSYLGMIDSNVTTISRALGGNVPEGGLNGHLSGS